MYVMILYTVSKVRDDMGPIGLVDSGWVLFFQGPCVFS